MERRGRLRGLAVAAVIALTLVGCGDGDSDDEATDTTGSTTTERETTTTAATTASTTTTVAVEDLGDEPAFRDDAASGSGCAPGPGDLPDGWWYGSLTGMSSESLELDLACFYVGPAAEAEAATRGDEVNNDYYVVNDNPAVRTLPLGGDATASCVDLDPVLEMVDCPPSEVAGDWTVWVRVVGGQIDRIWEQYLP